MTNISHVSIPCKSPGFPNKSSRNGFALYSFKASTIVIQVKDMKEATSLKISKFQNVGEDKKCCKQHNNSRHPPPSLPLDLENRWWISLGPCA